MMAVHIYLRNSRMVGLVNNAYNFVCNQGVASWRKVHAIQRKCAACYKRWRVNNTVPCNTGLQGSEIVIGVYQSKMILGGIVCNNLIKSGCSGLYIRYFHFIQNVLI